MRIAAHALALMILKSGNKNKARELTIIIGGVELVSGARAVDGEVASVESMTGRGGRNGRKRESQALGGGARRLGRQRDTVVRLRFFRSL